MWIVLLALHLLQQHSLVEGIVPFALSEHQLSPKARSLKAKGTAPTQKLGDTREEQSGVEPPSLCQTSSQDLRHLVKTCYLSSLCSPWGDRGGGLIHPSQELRSLLWIKVVGAEGEPGWPTYTDLPIFRWLTLSEINLTLMADWAILPTTVSKVKWEMSKYIPCCLGQPELSHSGKGSCDL